MKHLLLNLPPKTKQSQFMCGRFCFALVFLFFFFLLITKILASAIFHNQIEQTIIFVLIPHIDLLDYIESSFETGIFNDNIWTWRGRALGLGIIGQGKQERHLRLFCWVFFFYSHQFLKWRGFLVTEGYQFELNYFCLYLETVKVWS